MRSASALFNRFPALSTTNQVKLCIFSTTNQVKLCIHYTPHVPFWMQVSADHMQRLGEGEKWASQKFGKAGNGPTSSFQRAPGAQRGHFCPPGGFIVQDAN
uniref:Uncharacterized protein n=1 Tax=Naja naja TaxID=35670 RepID=A0A8C6XZ38_NAJNA